MDYNISNKGFYQPDLTVEYNEFKETTHFEKPKSGYYQIYFVLDGKFEFVSNDEVFIAKKDTLVLTGRKKSFVFRQITPIAKLVKIFFHDSFMKNYLEFDTLKFFNSAPYIHYFNTQNFENQICNNILNSLEKCLKEQHNAYFMRTKILALLSELDSYYLELKKEEKIDTSNATVKIIKYVDDNFTRNLTYNILKDKFFISDSTINKIFKQVTGHTFKTYLNETRLKHANNIMNDEFTSLSLAKIAESSGFQTYSTFYREYIKKYGVSPKKVYSKNIKNWPLE